jgi:hypothetical protein
MNDEFFIDRIRITCADIIKSFATFEMNDKETRNNVTDELTLVLSTLMKIGLIDTYQVICNETNNPPDVVEHSEFHTEVYMNLANHQTIYWFFELHSGGAGNITQEIFYGPN